MNVLDHKKYKSIDKTVLRAYNSIRSRQARKVICHAPFKSLRFSQSGNVLACCFNRGFVLGKYPGQPLHNIWFGDKIKELRNNILHYDLSSGCGECERRIGSHLFNLSGALQYDYLSEQRKKKYPVMLDFEISNTCNLECVMCLGENSSSIRSNREKLPPYQQHYDHKFVAQLHEFIPHLKEARFSGGEPFLIPLYYDIWEQLISGNPSAEISVLSNATVLNDKIRELLAKGNFRLSVSIDSLEKETFGKIRLKGDFNAVTENLDYFYNYSLQKNKTFSLNVCPMPCNYREIPAIVRYCNEKSIELVLHTVVFPPPESLWALHSSELKEVLEYIVSCKIEAKGKSGEKNLLTYKHFISQISGWIESAKIRESLKTELSGKDENNLIKLMQRHLQYSPGDPASAISEILMNTGLNENERKRVILNLLAFSPDLIISEFMHSEPEKLSVRLKMFNY